ncbi:hypothetical protein GCM10010433_50500 [Streptomyces pulveraceus]
MVLREHPVRRHGVRGQLSPGAEARPSWDHEAGMAEGREPEEVRSGLDIPQPRLRHQRADIQVTNACLTSTGKVSGHAL